MHISARRPVSTCARPTGRGHSAHHLQPRKQHPPGLSPHLPSLFVRRMPASTCIPPSTRLLAENKLRKERACIHPLLHRCFAACPISHCRSQNLNATANAHFVLGVHAIRSRQTSLPSPTVGRSPMRCDDTPPSERQTTDAPPTHRTVTHQRPELGKVVSE